MYKAILERVESAHNNMRTDEMEGICPSLPAVGSGFTIVGEGLESGCRVITTTRVVEIMEEKDDEVLFRTANSTCRLKQILEVLKEG